MFFIIMAAADTPEKLAEDLNRQLNGFKEKNVDIKSMDIKFIDTKIIDGRFIATMPIVYGE